MASPGQATPTGSWSSSHRTSQKQRKVSWQYQRVECRRVCEESLDTTSGCVSRRSWNRSCMCQLTQRWECSFRSRTSGVRKINPLSMKSRTRALDNLIGNKEPGNSIRAAMSSRVKTPIRPTLIPLQRNQPVLPHGGAAHWPRKRLYPNNEGAPGPCGSEFGME